VCSLVHRYDEMAEMVSEIPDESEALVELQRYYRKASLLYSLPLNHFIATVLSLAAHTLQYLYDKLNAVVFVFVASKRRVYDV